MRRLRVLMWLVQPAAKSIRWLPLVFGSAMGLITLHFMTRDPCVASTGEPCLDLANRIAAARVGAVLVALGMAFVLDDPSEDSTAHAPTGLMARRAVRVGIVLPPVALVWILELSVIRDSAGAARATEHFPFGALTLELFALIAVVLAVAVAVARFVPERIGGVAAGPILLGMVGSTFFLPVRLSLFGIDPGDPGWSQQHRIWQLALAVGIIALVWWSVDPWRRRLRGRLARGGPEGTGPERRYEAL
jgi:hypothetical protein